MYTSVSLSLSIYIYIYIHTSRAAELAAARSGASSSAGPPEGGYLRYTRNPQNYNFTTLHFYVFKTLQRYNFTVTFRRYPPAELPEGGYLRGARVSRYTNKHLYLYYIYIYVYIYIYIYVYTHIHVYSYIFWKLAVSSPGRQRRQAKTIKKRC